MTVFVGYRKTLFWGGREGESQTWLFQTRALLRSSALFGTHLRVSVSGPSI